MRALFVPICYRWERYHQDGYEVSTVGDKRFSAFNAYLGGKSIEYLYQVDYKGYPTIVKGKGRPPLGGQTKEESWEFYLSLWQEWAFQNPELIRELMLETTKHKILTDRFATTEINQAHALCHILNEMLAFI